MSQHIDQETDVKTKKDSEFKLREFLKENKVSDAALSKLEEPIKSGDLIVESLIDCSEKELNDVGTDYGLNTMQRKAFVKAIKKLTIASGRGDRPNNETDERKENEIKDKLKEFRELLKNEEKENASWITKNSQNVERNNIKLDQIGIKLKETIDEIILRIKNKQIEEFENYKLTIGMIEQDFQNDLNEIESNDNINIDDITNGKSMIDRLIEQSIEARKRSIISNINDIQSENMITLAKNIEKQLIMLCVNVAIDSNGKEKEKEKEKEEAKINNGSDLGRLRYYNMNKTSTKPVPAAVLKNVQEDGDAQEKQEKQHKHPDMDATKIKMVRYNVVDWHWDYCNKPNGLFTKHIKNNKKTFECNSKGLGCCCFARCNIPMKPNSGIYKIRFKIDKISNNRESIANIIGITCNTDKNNNWDKNHHYWYYSTDYIGWSSYQINIKENINSNEYDQFLPAGLLCGSSVCQKDNIFYKQKIKYKNYIDKYEKVYHV